MKKIKTIYKKIIFFLHFKPIICLHHNQHLSYRDVSFTKLLCARNRASMKILILVICLKSAKRYIRDNKFDHRRFKLITQFIFFLFLPSSLMSAHKLERKKKANWKIMTGLSKKYWLEVSDDCEFIYVNVVGRRQKKKLIIIKQREKIIMKHTLTTGT